MQLVCPIPTIHFKPVENKKKSGKGTLFIYLFIYLFILSKTISLSRQASCVDLKVQRSNMKESVLY